MSNTHRLHPTTGGPMCGKPVLNGDQLTNDPEATYSCAECNANAAVIDALGVFARYGVQVPDYQARDVRSNIQLGAIFALLRQLGISEEQQHAAVEAAARESEQLMIKQVEAQLNAPKLYVPPPRPAPDARQ